MDEAGKPWRAVRALAQARADALGLPTAALEDWRYVDVKPLASIPEKPLGAPGSSLPAIIASHALPNIPTLVLVDGVLSPGQDLSVLSCGDLGSLAVADREALIARWQAQIAASADVAECWSIAGCAGGARITATAGALHLLSLSTGGAHGGRIVIDVPRGAQLDLVISHIDLAPSRACLGIEVAIADGGRLRVDELQYAGHAAGTTQCLSTLAVTLGRDAFCQWTTIAQGGELVRFRSRVELAAPGADARLAGLSVLDGRRQAHVHTRVVHAQGNATSQQLFKTIADGQSIASFDGLVTVAPGADGTSARQSNHNLLLSPRARVETRPQLDILADDVKASHGATVGRPNPEELFYLRSRGLSSDQAMAVLMRGFADEVFFALHSDAARERARRVGQ